MQKGPGYPVLESWGLLYARRRSLHPATQDSQQACMAECVQDALRSAQNGAGRVLTAWTNKPAPKCKGRLERKYGRLAAMRYI